jgi:hypothetical protein
MVHSSLNWDFALLHSFERYCSGKMRRFIRCKLATEVLVLRYERLTPCTLWCPQALRSGLTTKPSNRQHFKHLANELKLDPLGPLLTMFIKPAVAFEHFARWDQAF